MRGPFLSACGLQLGRRGPSKCTHLHPETWWVCVTPIPGSVNHGSSGYVLAERFLSLTNCIIATNLIWFLQSVYNDVDDPWGGCERNDRLPAWQQCGRTLPLPLPRSSPLSTPIRYFLRWRWKTSCIPALNDTRWSASTRTLPRNLYVP